MDNKQSLSKENKDFATILKEELNKREQVNDTKDNTSNQQSLTNGESIQTIQRPTHSNRGGISGSPKMAIRRFGDIGYYGEQSTESANYQRRNAEISRSGTRDIRDTERAGADTEAEQRARRIDYLNQELQQKGDTIRKRIERFIQIDLHKTELAHNELESFKEQCSKQTELKNDKALIIQKALKTYQECGAFINTPQIQKSHKNPKKR